MPTMKFKLIGIALLVSAMASEALTLGRVRGAALIGRGLDVTVPVQLEAGETLAPGCVEVDVFHGDVRQDPSRVRITQEAASGAQGFNVHVVSSALVDEPVVTVYVRVVCGAQMSRRYVMLADVVSEGAAPTAAVVAPFPGAAVPVVAPAAVAEGGTRAPASPEAGAGTAAAPSSSMATSPPAPAVAARPATSTAARPRAPATAAAVRAKRPMVAPRVATAAKPVVSESGSAAVAERLRAGRNAGQSRLQLDQIEVLTERVATLESTTANQPVEAAARGARDAERVAAMETNIQRLLTLAAKNEANLQDVRARLEQAESERYSNPLVYGLVLILLLLLAACVLLLRRGSPSSGNGQAAGNWWNHGSQAADTMAPPSPMAESAGPSGLQPLSDPVPLSVPGVLSGGDAAAATLRNGPRTAAAPITQVDVSLVEMSESTFDRLMQSGVSHSAVRKPRPEDGDDQGPVPASTRQRSINSEELFDIRQQAEFFVSLGQTDQAVRILENRIAQNGESSPLAYLDLLKIFHSLGLRADFRQLRDDFSQLFHAIVPEFASFHEEGRELEQYPRVLAQIEEEWATPGVFPAIEEHIFKGQWNNASEPIDLAAFRDLLLLHAVAQWAQSPSESLPAPLVPSLAPSAVAGRAGSAASAFGALATATMEHDSQQQDDDDAPLPAIDGAAELDLDLSDLYGAVTTSAIEAAVTSAGVVTAPADISDEAAPFPEKDNLIDFDLSGLEFKNPKDAA